jgi:hypothetical protein
MIINCHASADETRVISYTWIVNKINNPPNKVKIGIRAERAEAKIISSAINAFPP